MVRIGFDPSLEAELQHRAAIKQSEYYRLLQEGSEGMRKRSGRYLKFLALIGSRLVLFGSALEERYGATARVYEVGKDTARDEWFS
jgi:hypothetical protein